MAASSAEPRSETRLGSIPLSASALWNPCSQVLPSLGCLFSSADDWLISDFGIVELAINSRWDAAELPHHSQPLCQDTGRKCIAILKGCNLGPARARLCSILASTDIEFKICGSTVPGQASRHLTAGCLVCSTRAHSRGCLVCLSRRLARL